MWGLFSLADLVEAEGYRRGFLLPLISSQPGRERRLPREYGSTEAAICVWIS